MVNRELSGINLERTNERLTGQGGFLAFGEYLKGMKIPDLVKRHLPAPGSNRGFGPEVFVQSLVGLLAQGGTAAVGSAGASAGGGAPGCDGTGGSSGRRHGGAVASADGGSGERVERAHRTGNGPGYGEPGDPVPGRGSGPHPGSRCKLLASGKESVRYSYLNEKGYMPMLGAFYETGVFVDDEFRDGNVSPQAGHVGVYRRAQELATGMGKRVARARADSASYQSGLINALEADKVAWTITADKNAAVMKRVRDGAAPPLFPEQVSWRYWVVATNFGPEWSAARVLEWHQLRGDFENFFKGLKNDVGKGSVPTGDFHANAVFFRIGVPADNLFVGFKRDLLPAACRTWSLRTVRWKLFALAGRIVRHARVLILKLAVDAESLAFLSRIRGQCRALFGAN